MPSYKVVWQGQQREMETIANLLSEVYYPPADAVSLVKADAAKEDAATGWAVESYFTDQPDIDGLEAFLSGSGHSSRPELEELPDQDWVAHALEGLGIVRCGRFILFGIHDADKLPDQTGDVPIRIDANQAFGTGHHPTTAGCLEVLDALEGLKPENILDLGTGSAVLAIAAMKLWDTEILATDIDPTSVDIARENAALNDAEGIHFLTAAGFDHQDISARKPYDFIIANILAGPLVELASDMAIHAKTGTRVLLAGLLAEQEEGVLTAYQNNGFALKRRHHHDTWPVLMFEKV